MWNTCKPMALSFQCMTKFTTNKKKKERKKRRKKKEDEIRNLPEKEFRIMIMKMIQNLENKMELQINSLETKMEKMQEMSNKDLEEIKKESIKNE